MADCCRCCLCLCRHDCCPMRHGVGCGDNQHCCPHDAPICDTDQGVCTSEDGKKTVPWTTKVPASYSSNSPKPLPEDDDDDVDEDFEAYTDYAGAMEGMDVKVGSDQELSGLSLTRQAGEQQQEQEAVAVV